MKRAVFLSASVPIREPFTSQFDPMAIREAVIALASIALRERPIVFGGHPAISPLVEHAARSLGAIENVHIYQSRFFEDKIPEAARKFPNLHWTSEEPENAPTEGGSLEAMRKEMIGSWDFCAAVFVGGMEGIFDECRLFREIHENKPLIVLGSTGGASAVLLTKLRNQFDSETLESLREERRYRRLLRKLLPAD
jgi:hypothetical protein